MRNEKSESERMKKRKKKVTLHGLVLGVVPLRKIGYFDLREFPVGVFWEFAHDVVDDGFNTGIVKLIFQPIKIFLFSVKRV